ncbi:MAG: nucleotidyltransferase domain-containing protein [Actinobacteria bacterium]|nr:nucleotidyltransferase domain-containing protein [Actinomycetota bacterium]
MLGTLLGSETRARVLSLLLVQPRRTYHLRELIRLAGGGASGVQREVARLEGLGLVVSERTAEGRRALRIVDEHPLLEPLRALVAAELAAHTPAGSVPLQLDARLRRRLPRVLAALRSADVERAVLFGSATRPEAGAAPRDLDVLVRWGGPLEGRATRYFELQRALERASGLPVDLVEEEAVTNPYLRDEIERTGVVILEAA